MSKVFLGAEDHLELREGRCPKCNHDNLDYGSREVQDSSVVWDVTCQVCGYEGEEVHAMTFLGYQHEGEVYGG